MTHPYKWKLHPLGEAGYQAELAKLVEWYEKRSRIAIRRTGELHRIYATLNNFNRPSTMHELCAALGVTDRRIGYFKIGQRVAKLMREGRVGRAGKIDRNGLPVVETRIRSGPMYQTLYEVVSPVILGTRRDRVQAKFEARLAELTARRQLGACLVQTGTKANSPRNGVILALRGEGMPLAAIGKQFGITRERVRQVIARNVKNVKHPSRTGEVN